REAFQFALQDGRCQLTLELTNGGLEAWRPAQVGHCPPVHTEHFGDLARPVPDRDQARGHHVALLEPTGWGRHCDLPSNSLLCGALPCPRPIIARAPRLAS